MKYSLPGFIGVLIAVMILFNGALSIVTGNYVSSIYIHVIGLLTVLLCFVITQSKLPNFKGIPIYLLAGGVIGVFTVLFNNISFSQLGVSLTLALGLLGQSIASIIVDHFSLFGVEKKRFSKRKVLPLTIIMAGIFLMMYV